MIAARTCLALIGLLILAGCGPNLRPRPARIDFGPVWVGQTASLPTPVEWRNSRSRSVTVTGVTVAGDPAFQVVDPQPSERLPAGKSGAAAQVTFTPSAVGERRATVTPIVGNARPEALAVMGTGIVQRQRGQLELTADGMIAARPLDLGAAVAGETITRGLYLANRGSAPMTVEARMVVGSAVRVLSPPLPLVLEPGRRVLVTLAFTPSAPGPFHDAFEAKTGDGTHAAGIAVRAVANP